MHRKLINSSFLKTFSFRYHNRKLKLLYFTCFYLKLQSKLSLVVLSRNNLLANKRLHKLIHGSQPSTALCRSIILQSSFVTADKWFQQYNLCCREWRKDKILLQCTCLSYKVIRSICMNIYSMMCATSVNIAAVFIRQFVSGNI